MNETYINGLPSIPFPPKNGENGEKGENVLFIYDPSSGITPSENDMALISKNGVTSMNIYDASNNSTALYKFEFTNKPNYTLTYDSSKGIIVKIIDADIEKIVSIMAYKTREPSTEVNPSNLFTYNTELESYVFNACTMNSEYAIYLYYKGKPYKITKYFLGTIYINK